MRKLLILTACAFALMIAHAGAQTFARVRVFRTTDRTLDQAEHRPGIVVRVDTGEARWADDAARSAADATGEPLVVLEPNDKAAAPLPPNATLPGAAAFTGMSFKPVFENDKVRVIRARMEVGAREAFHTHAADTVVVHLSGGEIEDTAEGKTVVNKWKPGDVEYEARGSSHSARNVGGPVDVVLVALK
jgi:quercetin dioxygenase-like cupin family protein